MFTRSRRLNHDEIPYKPTLEEVNDKIDYQTRTRDILSMGSNHRPTAYGCIEWTGDRSPLDMGKCPTCEPTLTVEDQKCNHFWSVDIIEYWAQFHGDSPTKLEPLLRS